VSSGRGRCENVGVSGGGVEVVNPRGVDVKEIGDWKGLEGNGGRIRLLAPVLHGDIWQSHANSRREMSRR
jgi:AICAR transformylase/IMP cyclohydrolase PurH